MIFRFSIWYSEIDSVDINFTKWTTEEEKL